MTTAIFNIFFGVSFVLCSAACGNSDVSLLENTAGSTGATGGATSATGGSHTAGRSGVGIGGSSGNSPGRGGASGASNVAGAANVGGAGHWGVAEGGAAAGSAGSNGTPAGGAGSGGASAAGAFLPARHPALPVLADNGGPVLTVPKVVTVTFPGDADATELEHFGATSVSGEWWDSVRQGYCGNATSQCVGRGTTGTNVRLSTTPATSYTDSTNSTSGSTVRTLIMNSIKAGSLPPPTDQTTYLLYFPNKTTITVDNLDKSCQTITDWHSWATYNNVQFSYVIVSECPPADGFTPLQVATTLASRQIANTATNPFPSSTAAGIALNGADLSTLPWFRWAGGPGVADLCVDFSTLRQDLRTDQGFTVQRIWNSALVAAGHDPCAPQPLQGRYFNVGPEKFLVIAKVGKPVTFTVDAFSDGPLSGGWSLSGLDLLAQVGGSTNPNEYLSFTFNGSKQAAVNNGDKVQVTVTLNKDPGANGAVGVLVSTSGTATAPIAEHEWPVLFATAADGLGTEDGIAKF